jgi:hypothetical protein
MLVGGKIILKMDMAKCFKEINIIMVIGKMI